MKTIEINAALRTNEKLSRNWVKFSAYVLLVLSSVLLIIFLVSMFAITPDLSYIELSGDYIFFESITELYSQHFPDFFQPPIIEGLASFLSEWIYFPLIFAVVGFLSFIAVTYVDGSMILENKSWLVDLQEQGLIDNFSTYKNLVILTEVGKITISKNNMKYKVKLPKLDNYDLSRFGLVSEDNLITCLCSKKELTGILHIFLSKVN